MSLWKCSDRISGEQFEVRGNNRSDILMGVEGFIRHITGCDTGTVAFDVTCTTEDGRECHFDNQLQQESESHEQSI